VRKGRGALLLALALLAGSGSCRRQGVSFQRPAIVAAHGMGRLLRDGSGRRYFRRPGRTLPFGSRGRVLRLSSFLAGSCCLSLHFWSPSRGRLRLRVLRVGGAGSPAREFGLRRGPNDVCAELRLRRSDRLVLEADHDGVFSQPLLYRLLPAAERRNIFLISADNLGADHLELYGYHRPTAPAISDFRRQAVLFRWAFANSPWTLPSHMSLFTSLPETKHGVTFHMADEKAAAGGNPRPEVRAFPLGREKEFLVERLSRSFITCGFTGGINVAASFGFFRGFDLYEEAPNDHLAPDSAARLFKRAASHLLRSRFPAAFYFLHTYQVHLPYRPPPDLLERIGRTGAPRSFDLERDLGGITGIFGRGDERRRSDAADLYDAEIMEFDRRFGEFIAFLKRSGLYERSMVILLADHGEEFFEHGSWAHGTDLFNSQIRVPLLVKFPDGRYAGRSFDGAVSLVDVLPTVLDYFGTAAPPAACGRSLLGELDDDAPPPAPVFSANLDCRPWSRLTAQAAVIQGGYKLIRQFPRKAAETDFFIAPPPAFPLLQLFRLAGDAGEERDLASTLPQLTARMNDLLQRFLEARPASGQERSQVLPDETLNMLRSLGYVR
jgi:choline-sulfatase